MQSSKGYAAQSADSPLAPHAFTRRDPGPTEVTIDILYCGVCHSDLHMARNEWGNSIYPMVPGHEIVGRVSAVGSAVTKFKSATLLPSASSWTPAAIALPATAAKSTSATRARRSPTPPPTA